VSAPGVTGEAIPCPEHGGPKVPPGERTVVRDCGPPGHPLVALIVDGRTVRHMGPREAIGLGMAITGLAQTSAALARLADGQLSPGRAA
jgi:hypothetical protein